MENNNQKKKRTKKNLKRRRARALRRICFTLISCIIIFLVGKSLLVKCMSSIKDNSQIVGWIPKLETKNIVSERFNGLKIVIDAGHGGFDPGTIGIHTNRYEKEINLEIAEILKDELEKNSAQVIMTRNDDNAIAPNKDDDMETRSRIIEQSSADLVISIHQNYSEIPEVKGPQILFYTGDSESEKFADCLQTELNEELDGTRPILFDNYKLLKNRIMPSVIVECGFISNYEEEKQLQKKSYQKKLVNALLNGIENYISEEIE